MNSEQLDRILADHALWLSSDKKQGKRADLSGANLTRAYLFRANLTRAYLYRANLTRANLYGANLTGADLSGARLTGAELGPQIRECLTFKFATVSEDQLAWLCLHPRFGEWRDSLEVSRGVDVEVRTT